MRTALPQRYPGACRVLGFGSLMLLGACTPQADISELQAYVSAVRSRTPETVEPPPQFLAYAPFAYSAASLRGPFDVPVDLSQVISAQRLQAVKPDPSRPHEYLEDFALGTLMMTGTLSRGAERWALLRDTTNAIHRVAIGSHIGRNHGRIVAITDAHIDVSELIATGADTWIERPQRILLQVPTSAAMTVHDGNEAMQ